MANIFSKIFKRDTSSTVDIVTTTGVVPKSESTASTPFTNALLFNQQDKIVALKLSAVYAAVSMISNSIATLPIYVKQHKDNEDTILYNNYVQKLFYEMLQTKHMVIKQLVWDLLLWGNAYLYIKRENNRPVKLIYLQHGDVTIDYRKQDDIVEYQCCNHTQVPSLVKQQDMLHFARDTRDGIEGRGFMFFASDIINLAGFTQRAAENFFGSGCNLTGILQFKGRLREEQKEAIRQQWIQIHSSGAAGGGLGITEGDAEYIPISQNSSDAQMLDTREYNVVEIARFFNISPILLGDLSHTSYNDIEQAQIEFVQHTLLPIINLLEDEINRKLITNRNNYIDFDETQLLTGNKATLANYYSTLVSNAIITINEAREQLGWNSIDGADDLILPYSDVNQNTVNEQEVEEQNNI